MSDVEVLPELKEIIGAMLFAAKHPVTPSQIRRALVQVAEIYGGSRGDFAAVKEAQIKAVIAELSEELEKAPFGISLGEIAGGYRLENDVACGPWVRQLLEKGKPSKLSRPALETLAIIAYRQPCVRSEIEAVRGVAVDQILRNLLEMQLVRIVGRSDLPGRPMLYGTTQKFMEYFGIKDLNDLPGVEELRRMQEDAAGKKPDGKPAEDIEQELPLEEEEPVEGDES